MIAHCVVICVHYIVLIYAAKAGLLNGKEQQTQWHVNSVTADLYLDARSM